MSPNPTAHGADIPIPLPHRSTGVCWPPRRGGEVPQWEPVPEALKPAIDALKPAIDALHSTDTAPGASSTMLTLAELKERVESALQVGYLAGERKGYTAGLQLGWVSGIVFAATVIGVCMGVAQ